MRCKVVINKCFGGFTLSKKARIGLNKLKSNSINIEYGYIDDAIERHDKDLIKTIELLGEEASGTYSKLVIVELPEDEDEYYIDEYDGLESVKTRSTIESKWIKIK